MGLCMCLTVCLCCTLFAGHFQFFLEKMSYYCLCAFSIQQWRSQDDRVTRALYGHAYSCTVPGGSTSFLAIRKGSRTIFMHFNIAFELDSGLFLAAAVAEGTQQSNEARLTNYNDL